jgi:hypothetical protein
LSKKVSNFGKWDFFNMGFFSWGHGNLSCQHGIFSKCHAGKKSHVDMRFFHVNMGFFSQHGILKKSHVNMEHLFLMMQSSAPAPGAQSTWDSATQRTASLEESTEPKQVYGAC